MSATYEQSPRPLKSIPVDQVAPRPTSTVTVVRVTPVDENGRPKGSESLTSRIAKIVSESRTCLLASWSRDEVDVVLDLPAGVDALATVVELCSEIRSDLDLDAITAPDDWDTLHRTAERAARAALGDRHQCQDTGWCACWFRGNQYPRTDRNHRGEFGSRTGLGAEVAADLVAGV